MAFLIVWTVLVGGTMILAIVVPNPITITTAIGVSGTICLYGAIRSEE